MEPLAENKFKGTDSEYLGELIMTPCLVIDQIGTMTENKSPGIDVIRITVLLQTTQLFIPQMMMFNLSLKRGIIPEERKEPKIITLFKKCPRNKSENYRLQKI